MGQNGMPSQSAGRALGSTTPPERIARAPNMRVLVELAIELWQSQLPLRQVASRKPLDDHEIMLVLGSSE
jgi:hypothetical protein